MTLPIHPDAKRLSRPIVPKKHFSKLELIFAPRGYGLLSAALIILLGIALLAVFAGNRSKPADSSRPTGAFSAPPMAVTNTLNSVQPALIPAPVHEKICFTRGDFIYLKEQASGKEVRIIKGLWPDISPDGTKILFMPTPVYDANDPPWRSRPWHFRLLDLPSKTVKEFATLVGRDAMTPTWSNDGSKVAFETVDTNRGCSAIGLLDPATGEWKILVGSVDLGVGPGNTFTFDSWVKDDHSILVHTLQFLYEVSLDGKLVWQMPIDDLDISSATRFSLSSDKKYLLFDSTISTKERPVNQVLKVLDVSTMEVITVTPDTVEATMPMWLPTEKAIIFGCKKRFGQPPQSNICTIGIDGKSLSILVNDALMGSIR